MLYPYKFTPILVERVWGGQALARFGKPVPADKRIGESWEISDRDDAQSVIANGPDKGRTLRQQIEAHGKDLLGTNSAQVPRCPSASGSESASTASLQHSTTPSLRFPLLIKLLDCRERLSLQVHPPAGIAARLGGEPKTEMWYALEADNDAHLIAGLRRGVTGADFIRALEATQRPSVADGKTDDATGTVGSVVRIEDCVHRFPVTKGDVFFVPSGRLHAIDAGVVLVEIQQNSDTTYRAYDWGRTGLDGKPRPLHVQESLACIDFQDFEPKREMPRVEDKSGNGLWRLVECGHFCVHKLELCNAWLNHCDGSTFHILACLSGRVGLLTADGKEERLGVGEFVVLPATLGHYTLAPLAENTHALRVFVPPRQ
jgi:mannose-6-phosphate isomerase